MEHRQWIAMRPLRWAFVIGIGMLTGVGTYTFIYARGASYLTDKPEACINCHVMNQQYAGWIKGSHRSVAVCNDCHTPDGMIAKYAAKAMYGFLHAYVRSLHGTSDRLILGEAIDYARQGQLALQEPSRKP